MMKTRSLIIGLIAMIVVMGCESNHHRAIREELEIGNKRCPIVLNQELSITGMELDEDTIVCKILMTEDFYTIGDINRTYDKMRKLFLMEMVSSDSSKELYANVANNFLWMKYACMGQQSKKVMAMMYSPEEIKNAIENPPSKGEMTDLSMDLLFERLKSMLPKELEKGVVLADIIKDNTAITYVCELDERYYDVDLMNTNGQQVKESLVPQIASDKFLLRVLVDSNRELKFKYMGNKSGKAATISFTTSELREIYI